MKKQNHPNLDGAFTPVSAQFDARVQETLRGLKCEEAPKVKRFTLSTIGIAAIILVLLVGTALAVGGSLGLLDFLSENGNVTPQEDAGKNIVTDLGSDQDDSIRMTVREAVYDGTRVRILVEFTALEPEKYVLARLWEDDADGSEASSAEADAALAARTGRELLYVAYPYVDSTDDSIPMDFQDTDVIIRRQDDSLLMYLETRLDARETDVIVDELHLGVFFDQSAMGVGFSLRKCESARTEYMPDTNTVENLTIEHVYLTQTPFADYLEVMYSVTDKTPDTAAQTIDSSAVYYATPIGRFVHTQPSCSGMTKASEMTGAQVIEAKRVLCPVCAGGDFPVFDEVAWSFLREDAPVYTDWSCYVHESEASDGKCYVVTSIYSVSDMLPETLRIIANNRVSGVKTILTCTKIKE